MRNIIIALIIILPMFTFAGYLNEGEEPPSTTGTIALRAIVPHYYDSPRFTATLAEIMRRESGNDPEANNPTSSAYGLCQALDKTWSEFAGPYDDRDDPEDQWRVCRLILKDSICHWEPYTGPYEEVWGRPIHCS